MKAPLSMRLWFAFMAAVLWTGIFLTGYSTASWLFYLPAAALTMASIIGICPTYIAISKFLNAKKR